MFITENIIRSDSYLSAVYFNTGDSDMEFVSETVSLVSNSRSNHITNHVILNKNRTKREAEGSFNPSFFLKSGYFVSALLLFV